ncbi:unnamed protein product [Rotaria sp. Silwood2]|nr:unnamed protein product [Rotaria sp. Silwood2]CAF4003449.1 unnamed protein product [Rotaria sp. Silwood2]
MKLKTLLAVLATALSLSAAAQSEADQAARDFGVPTGSEAVQQSMLKAQAKKAQDDQAAEAQRQKDQQERDAQKAREAQSTPAPKPKEN